MNQPTIHFTETMRGQGVLVAASQNRAAVATAEVTLPEDQKFVQQQFARGCTEGQEFAMVWRDLDVAVATQTKNSAGGLWGTIHQGTIQVDGVDRAPLVLEQGTFELLPAVGPRQRRMRYQLRCRSANGQRHFTLYGFKEVVWQAGHRRLWALWQATTTLYVTVYEHKRDGVVSFPINPNNPETELIATGVIRIFPLAFAHQLLTFRSTGVSNLVAHISNFWRFFRFFAGTLMGVYFGSSTNPSPAFPNIKEGV